MSYCMEIELYFFHCIFGRMVYIHLVVNSDAMLVIECDIGKLSSSGSHLRSCLFKIQLLLSINSTANHKHSIGIFLMFRSESLNTFNESFF